MSSTSGGCHHFSHGSHVDWNTRADHRTPGYNHFCLLIDNLATTLKEMEVRGLPVAGTPVRGLDNNWQYWIKDPDGNPIELMQIMTDSPHAVDAKWHTPEECLASPIKQPGAGHLPDDLDLISVHNSAFLLVCCTSCTTKELSRSDTDWQFFRPCVVEPFMIGVGGHGYCCQDCFFARRVVKMQTKKIFYQKNFS
jgi:Glyoxalase/Bleomycin resistance protein/Dioxygenase superfamily